MRALYMVTIAEAKLRHVIYYYNAVAQVLVACYFPTCYIFVALPVHAIPALSLTLCRVCWDTHTIKVQAMVIGSSLVRTRLSPKQLSNVTLYN